MDPLRHRLALRRYQVEFQKRQPVCLRARPVANDDPDAVGTRLALQPGRQVHGIAQH
ncbi:MAG: hypothetical protein VW547_11975 [Alphaproteobacteria bacterium]